MKNVILSVIGAALVCSCAGHTGGQGVQGVAGTPGQNGNDGATGPQGETGTKGADGGSATIIQLCPGVSTHAVFVEVALCLNNELYAVYSANGGFLTYLAPGAYTSNGIGSACNLTVHENCIITH